MKKEFDWENMLTEEEFRVTREKGTEYPFTGIYNDFFKKGTYKCKCCGEVLFSSATKFESGCGWPSFFDVASTTNVKQEKDTSHGMIRTEVMCASCDAHLGHVFNDGPKPTGLRYCINSVSLNFEED